MKSLFFVIALASVAYADRFPDSGPCEDAESCEAACKLNKKGTCYWGGVLVLQRAVDDSSKPRALVLFEKACTKGNVDACFQVAQLVWDGEGDDPKAVAAFQRACNKSHARACWTLGLILANDEKNLKRAGAAKAKGVRLMQDHCVRGRMSQACLWAARVYEAGDIGVKKDLRKGDLLRDRACMIDTGARCPNDAPRHITSD